MRSPVSARREKLAEDIQLFYIADSKHNDWQVARYTVGPKAGLAELIRPQPVGRRAGMGIRIEDERGKLLKILGLLRLEMQMAKLQLGIRPGKVDGARNGVHVGV